jgi:hypothetical protein
MAKIRVRTHFELSHVTVDLSCICAGAQNSSSIFEVHRGSVVRNSQILKETQKCKDKKSNRNWANKHWL